MQPSDVDGSLGSTGLPVFVANAADDDDVDVASLHPCILQQSLFELNR